MSKVGISSMAHLLMPSVTSVDVIDREYLPG